MSRYPDSSGDHLYSPVKQNFTGPPQASAAYQDGSSVRPSVVQAPIPQYTQSQRGYPAYPARNSGAWNTGLCGCFEDAASSCVGFWCPCVLVGKSVESIDDGATSCGLGGAIFLLLTLLTGCGCCYTCIYRSRLREKYGLPGSTNGDFWTECCCLPCSICQVYRELEKRNALTPGYGELSPSSTALILLEFSQK
ncbi:hypothetical protein R1sor_011389 [Riccia sorocarpa]|uniref:Uncharacterized protein n=1 Tax=Riccia sorocarpa TaxID=122646 RepID=A0ABD3I146_9MARC